MTTERKRALLIIVATLIVGILIGALGVGLMGKQNRITPAGWRKDGKEAFIEKILGVIDADSIQAKKIRPVILETIAKIDSIQAQTDTQVRIVVDSFEVKVRPVLSEVQLQKLKQFHKKGRARK